MSDLPRRKRSFIATFIAILVIAGTLIDLVAVRVNTFLFRRNIVLLESLKFPVLIIQPDGISPFAEWEAVQLEKFSPKSARTPVDGTVIIDSDFNFLDTGERKAQKRRRPEVDGPFSASGSAREIQLRPSPQQNRRPSRGHLASAAMSRLQR